MYTTRRLWGAVSLLLPFLTGGCGAGAPDSADGLTLLPEALSGASAPLAAKTMHPQLDAVSLHAASNRGGTPLILTGRNFATGATVKIGGALARSSVLSSTTIALTVPALPGRCGAVPVRVENPVGGADTRSDLFSYQGEFGYSDPLQYAVGSYANEIAVADFNVDGHLDIAVSVSVGSQVSLLTGLGDGTFRPVRNINSGAVPLSIVTADFNNDGNPDLAVSDAEKDGTGYMLLGNGHSVPGVPFKAPAAFSSLEYIDRLKSDDFNSDGKPDLLVLGDTSFGVLLGKGDGTFAAHLDVRRTERPWDATSGDLNGDGHPDVVVSNRGTNNVSVFLGKGNGTFTGGEDYPTDKSPIFLAIADVNRDGKLDVISGNALTISVLLGKGDGTVAAAKHYTATAHSLNDMAVRDLDGDGVLDAVVVDELGNLVNVLHGNGDGSFAAPQSFASGAVANWLGIGDFDGDHRLDLAATSFTDPGSVAVLLRECM